jgi:hypothetical protein
MPKYYRMTPGSVNRFWVVETYYFQTVEDRETFFAWTNIQPEGTFDTVEMNGCSIMLRWNR